MWINAETVGFFHGGIAVFPVDKAQVQRRAKRLHWVACDQVFDSRQGAPMREGTFMRICATP
jgi:hypothetical protein